ncbi:flagellin [Bacillus cereus]|uniref:flagellin N-terminal helical domain-containing protein n=1 Tax=Bacillus TaxID=1386 RepID=UPI000471504C|nr:MULTISPECIES: flagellin [Bacillus]PAW42111.1 flagellin [Bacillus toyonensis]KIZ30028.1 flagellin [Bacillus cereus]MDZ4627843.1 flagellin [Bacillus cereus]ONG62838.1 flagellin [Bacillus cereus]PGU95586.1 flagellin [Bacillus thuringiensis]
MRINTNINSMRTQEYMRQNQAKMSNAMDRLSSGKRINNASDDAAGLAIATRMRARESGLGVAANNTQDGMSLIRTADSALNSVSNILLRMRDIANQSANGTNTKENQGALNKEFDALKEQITYIAENTQFNDKNLLNTDQVINIQTLDSSEGAKQIGIQLKGANLKDLKIDDLKIEDVAIPQDKIADLGKFKDAMKTFEADFGAAKDETARKKVVSDAKAQFDKVKDLFDGTKVTAFENAMTAVKTADSADNTAEFAKVTETLNDVTSQNTLKAIDKIDNALKTIADNRATLGATLNRLDFNVNNLKSQSASMASAASQIEDADMAKEMSEMTKFKILNEAGISMLSQANQTPQMVSKLLQ